LVEHDLAKVGVAGSSPVFRSKNPNFGSGFFLSLSIDALVVELVDTQDLKSCGPQRPCGFDSRLRHKASHKRERLFLCEAAKQACLIERMNIKKVKQETKFLV
jgi:hypothetical protein